MIYGEEGFVPKIEIGLKGKKEICVEDKDLASFLGNFGAEVLSTPRLIGLLEEASRSATEECLPEGSMTVGTRPALSILRSHHRA